MLGKISPTLLSSTRLSLDVGEYFVVPLMLTLVKPISREQVDELARQLRDILRGLEDTHIVLLNDDVVYSQEHLIYSVNVGLRCARQGPQFARKPELNIVCVLTISSQIETALRKLFSTPIRRLVVVAISRSIFTIADALERILELFRDLVLDICLCYKCTRNVPNIRSLCDYANDVIDLFQCIAETVLDRVR